MTDLYRIFCFLAFLGLGSCQFFGWCFADFDRDRDVPTTVRSNPGSYRAHYSSYHGGSHYVHITGK